MKFKWDKKYLYWGATALIVLALTVLFNFLLNNNKAIRDAFTKLVNILLPIIFGFVMAFLINPLMKWFEKSVFTIFDKKAPDRKLHPKWKKNLYRILSMVFSYFVILLLIATFVIAVIPQIRESIINIADLFPVYKDNFMRWITGLTKKYPELAKFLDNFMDENEHVIDDWTNNTLYPWLKNLAASASVYVFNIFSVIKNLIIGFIVSIYILFKKETFKGQSKKIVYSLFNIKNGNIIIKNTRMANDKFSGFIVGKIVDSLIIGFLCFVGCSIIKIEYPVLIALIIGVTNIIPFFGPIIGAIPCVLLLLLINPIHSLYFLIFVIVLQQVDGNIIGPKILGSSTGISSFWVIFAITIFGGFWGVPGMIVGVPLFAVIYTLVQSMLEIALKNKELPQNTENYVYLDHIDKESGEFVEKELPSVLMDKAKQKKIEEKELRKQEKLKKAAEKEKNKAENMKNKAENNKK
ncbi:MAG: AI-2E family transporter [Lachnospiraceae bacterium]|nr:AI-2E family transporter [Lachnospiraceae bacterium]